MNPALSFSPILVCCSVLGAEVERLLRTYWPHLGIRFANSMLHMKPEVLGDHLQRMVEEACQQGHQVLLVYGDCSLQMARLEARPGVVRTRGHNCCELLLGREDYRQLSHQGAFFLLPEWARRWEQVFALQLGLNRDNATSLMRDMHRKLMYLDTGVTPIPKESLEACARYCGLHWEVRMVSLEPLRAAIEEGLMQLEMKPRAK